MGKKRSILFITLLIAVLGCLTWALLNAREPALSYQGKSAEIWLGQYLENPDGSPAQTEAKQAIQEIGTNALPLYVKWLGEGTSSPKNTIAHLIQLLHGHSYAHEEHILMVHAGFTVLGSTARPAVPALTRLLETNNSAEVQGDVIMSLGEIGPAASDAIPALINYLNDTNHIAAVLVPNTLARIHEKPELIVPALTRHLNDSKDRPVRCLHTIQALGTFGETAKSAVPAILVFVNDQDSKIREAATNALKAINPITAAKAGIK